MELFKKNTRNSNGVVCALLMFAVVTLAIIIEAGQARQLIYKEEFYRIYYLPQKYANDDLARTLRWLELAEKAPFAPPIQALQPHENEADYLRYRALLNLHIQYLLARNTLYLAARFDKHRPVYFNLPYSEDILKSLDIAEYLYNNAELYWGGVRTQFESIRQQKGRSSIEFLERTMDRIRLKQIDFGRVIARKKKKLQATRDYFKNNGNSPLPAVEPPRATLR